MKNQEILQTLVIFNKEFNNTLITNVAENESILVKDITLLINTFTIDNKFKNGKINGNSQNTFEKDINHVYVSVAESIYLNDGNINVNYCFDTTYTNTDTLPVLLPGSVLQLKPTFKSGTYEDMNITVILKFFEEYKIYEIVKNTKNYK